MAVGTAAPVKRLAVCVPDGVDLAVVTQHLQMPVDGREPNVLAAPAQLSVDLLSAAESGQPVEHRDQRLGLPGPSDPRPAGGRWRLLG